MKTSKTLRRRWPALAGVLIAVFCVAAVVETATGVPNIFNPNESSFQSQTHFLVFTGSDTAGENATTAAAYYDAIDPTHSKRTFPEWLVKNGFIANVSEWNPTGPQKTACGLGPSSGCDYARGTHGPGIINTDSHAIVLNASDLGFVRNQYIRCDPSCTATNPKIYTYLENYPVNPFSNSATGGSGFPILTGYPSQDEAAAAISSALTRPLGNLPGCVTADTALGCSIQRIADVAFEWAPQPTNPTSSFRYGQLYAFVFSVDGNNQINETISFPFAPDGTPVNGVSPNVATGLLEPFTSGDPFPPNLDFLGNKQHPGVCFICHGGNPKSLDSTGAYPRQGVVSGFRFLPLDNRNLLFSSDSGPEPTSRVNQEAQVKIYNQLVLRTVPVRADTDEQGTTRVAHLREVIQGWYAGGALHQQDDFIPVGWREASHGGTAPAGSEQLYKTVLGPSCRSCHFNRELSLDFGTVANFDAYRADVLELTLMPLCQAGSPPRGKRPMPLAHLTYQRFWEATSATHALPGEGGDLILQDTAGQIARHFGFSGLDAYCATVH